MKDGKDKWVKHPSSAIQRKVYENYDAYLAEQKSKMDAIDHFTPKYLSEFKSLVGKTIWELPFINRGTSALCLGARQGTEVEAFLDAGCFAVGVDLNTGKNNKYVVTGDFHNLQFADGSVDVAFTNCLDHVYRPLLFLEEVKRVLKPGGHFIVYVAYQGEIGEDKWSSMYWKNSEELIKLFLDNGYELISRASGDLHWFEEQLVFATNQTRKENR